MLVYAACRLLPELALMRDLAWNSSTDCSVQDSDISWVFDLPTDFATVLDTDKLRAMPK